MYRKIYRQEGGLAEEGYRAQLRQAREKAIEDWNRRTRGEAAERVRPRPRRAYRPANIPLDTERQRIDPSINQLVRLGTEYIKNPTKIPTDKGLTTLFHGTPYKESIMKEGFTSPKVFTTTDPKKALDYAKEGRLRGTPFGPVTGDVLETKVPTSQVESLLKRGLTRTPEVVLSPEEATKIFQTGSGDIVGSPSLLTKIGKTVGRLAGPVGTGLSIADAIARYKAGDYSGAVLSTLSAIPGFGIPATVAQLGTDYMGWTGTDKDEGGLASLPEAQDVLTKEQFEKTLPEGYRPLNVTYDAYWDKYGTKPYKDILKERVETRKDMYSGMPVILTPKDSPFFQMYYKGPKYNLHTRPGEDRDEYMSRRHSPPVDPWWDQYQQQQPTGFEGTGDGGLADLPEAQTRGQKVYYTDSTGSTLYPGYLGLDYGDPGFMPDFEKKYTESPYKTTKAEWDKAWNKGVNQSVPIQPTGFEGTGYGQFSPQPTGPMPVVPGGPII